MSFIPDTTLSLLLHAAIIIGIIYSSIGISIIYTSVWLIPCFLYGYKDYIPIWNHNASNGYHDDYFYYTRIKKIIDGDFLNSDPIIKDFHERPHIHCSYQLSYFAGSIFALKTKNIYHAFFGNTLFYPLLHSFVVFCFSYLITNSYAAALLTTVLFTVYIEYGTLRRFPNIMFTGIHVMLVGLYALLYTDNALSLPLSCLFIPVIGLSPVISLPNMLFAATVTFLTIVIDIEKALAFWPFFSVSGLLALVLFLYTLKHDKSRAELFKFAHFSPKETALAEIKSYGKRYVLPLAAALPVYALAGGGSSKALALLLAASLIAPLVVYIQSKNIDFASRLILRGSAEFTFVAGYAALLSVVVSAANGMGRYTPMVVDVCMLGVAVFLITRQAGKEIRTESARAPVRIKPTLRELVAWSQKLGPDENILTLDFDLNINLPVYTPAYFFLPHAIQSTATEEEIWTRFEDACAFFQVSAADYFRFINALPRPGASQDPRYSQVSNATRMLTYGQYYTRWHLPCIFDEQTLALRIKSYRRRLASLAHSPVNMAGKASILIISRWQLVGKDFCAKLFQLGIPTLFANSDYAAFSITDSIPQTHRP